MPEIASGRRRVFLSWTMVFAVIVFVLTGLIEIGVRASGLTDFPTYLVDGEIGYIPRPNQTGRFLGKNLWVFNDHSMGTDRPWQPDANTNILLIGNSVVMGGNHYDQHDKLGPLIQPDLEKQDVLWPIAAGGWTNVNETVYLERHPEVVAATHVFVWEVMAGGFSRASGWEGDYIWPRGRPLWATWYVFRHDVVPRILPVNANELPPTGSEDPAAFARFAAMVGRLSLASRGSTPGILLLYPTEANLRMAERGREWLAERPQVLAVAARYHLKVVDLAQDPGWNTTLYRDGVHPTVQGNVVLAAITARAIKDALGP